MDVAGAFSKQRRTLSNFKQRQWESLLNRQQSTTPARDPVSPHAFKVLRDNPRRSRWAQYERGIAQGAGAYCRVPKG